MNNANSAVVGHRPLALGAAHLGMLFSALLLFMGFAFPTYDIKMQSDQLDFMRQVGLPFMVAELAVVLFAASRGFSIDATWRALPRSTRIALALFLATFWISSVFVSPFPVFSTTLCLVTVSHLLFLGALVHVLGPASVKDIEASALWMAEQSCP